MYDEEHNSSDDASEEADDEEGGEDDEEGGDEDDDDGANSRYFVVPRVVDGNTATDVPCGMCQVKDKCTPNGFISPQTCPYFEMWMDF